MNNGIEQRGHMKIKSIILVLIISFIVPCVHAQNAREDFSKNLNKFGDIDFGSADADSLIKETIEAYHQLDPKPALPAEAETFLFQGEAAVEMAKDKEVQLM